MNDVVARETMLDTQVRPNDVTDRRIHIAIGAIPREAFLSRSRHALAYAETEHPTAENRWMWRARDFSKLLQAAQIGPDDLVLDIAPGTGYSTAVLSKIAAAVVGIEDDKTLAESASETLDSLNIDNADVEAVASLADGFAAQGPYNVIFVNGSVEVVPEAWLDQLAEGGRLAVVVREGRASHARIYTRSGDAVSHANVFDAAAPRLPGFEAEAAFVF